jgi:hypothetical protein
MSLRLAALASVVVGTLVGAFYYQWQRRPSLLAEAADGPVSVRGDRARFTGGSDTARAVQEDSG